MELDHLVTIAVKLFNQKQLLGDTQAELLKTLCSIRVVLLSILNEHQRVSQGPHISESVAKAASWSIQYPSPKRTEDFFTL